MQSIESEMAGCLPITIPELVVVPTRAQIFMFSAITWNRHHIHYDRDAAVREGLPDVVTQRALIGDFFARMILNWLDGDGEISEISWRVHSSAPADSELRCSGYLTNAVVIGADTFLEGTMNMTDVSGKTVATGTVRIKRNL